MVVNDFWSISDKEDRMRSVGHVIAGRSFPSRLVFSTPLFPFQRRRSRQVSRLVDRSAAIDHIRPNDLVCGEGILVRYSPFFFLMFVFVLFCSRHNCTSIVLSRSAMVSGTRYT